MSIESIDPDKKFTYFYRIALETRNGLSLHKKQKLWEKEGNQKPWRNVSEHCIVEAARVSEIARLTGLSSEWQQKLKHAAILHDFYKRQEVEAIKSGKGDT